MTTSARELFYPSRLLTISLHAGFVLTGIGTTLLGNVLPSLSNNWHLNDSKIGMILAAQFAGASCGALLVQSRLYVSILAAFLGICASSACVGLCHGQMLVPLFFFFGLGLGTAMTAISMFAGRFYLSNRASSLSLLNASWGVGAIFSPILVSFWMKQHAASSLYMAISVSAFLVCLLLLLQSAHWLNIKGNFVLSKEFPAKLRLLIPLGIFAFLYVGVEASIGSWMMTFIQRLHISSSLLAPLTTSFFWIALVAGRAIVPAVLLRITELQFLNACLGILILSNLLLLMSRTSALNFASALFAGLALAPIFPLCLAKVFAITDRPAESRWIFAFSGFGGAVFPWITGQVATYSHSLRMGLATPLLAACLMIALLRLIQLSELHIAPSR